MSAVPDVFRETVQAIHAELVTGNLFGKPAAKFDGGKPIFSFFQDSMVFKLGSERCQELIAQNPECQLFDPSGKGRPFKDWVQVPESAGLDWLELGSECIAANEQGV